MKVIYRKNAWNKDEEIMKKVIKGKKLDPAALVSIYPVLAHSKKIMKKNELFPSKILLQCE